MVTDDTPLLYVVQKLKLWPFQLLIQNLIFLFSPFWLKSTIAISEYFCQTLNIFKSLMFLCVVEV